MAELWNAIGVENMVWHDHRTPPEKGSARSSKMWLLSPPTSLEKMCAKLRGWKDKWKECKIQKCIKASEGTNDVVNYDESTVSKQVELESAEDVSVFAQILTPGWEIGRLESDKSDLKNFTFSWIGRKNSIL